MKQKNDAGFSLIEVLVAITLLAAIVVPTCSSLIMSFRMNAKTEKMLQAQLAVSSAVETLMAEGIPNDVTENQKYEIIGTNNETGEPISRFPDVTIHVTVGQTTGGENAVGIYYVTVTSVDEPDVTVTTTIRAVATANGGTS